MRIVDLPPEFKVHLNDPSEYRPEYVPYTDITAPMPAILQATGKPQDTFRNYNTDTQLGERVKQTYLKMHTQMTVEFVRNRRAYWSRFDKHQMTIMEGLELLNTLVDESDPDTSVPNIYHAFQTAERIRKAHPDKDWFHLTGLIHDLGKVMAIWGEPQFAVVGDTFPVGCQFAPSIVFRGDTFHDNPDLHHPVYSTKNGIYVDKVGLTNVEMSFGHDEYMARFLVHNQSTLPKEALAMVRFHSFYPWHTGGDYMHLCDDEDLAMMPWVLEFNKFDLYSKSDGQPDIQQLMPYYQALIDKYIPGVLEW